MTRVLMTSARRIRVLAVAAALACAMCITIGESQAQAGGTGNYCGVVLAAGATCHGGWVNGLFALAGQGNKVCVAVQGFSGGYYNITGWACGFNPFQEFGTVNGYPSIYNNSGSAESVAGVYWWH